jgi:hypothetical protein
MEIMFAEKSFPAHLLNMWPGLSAVRDARNVRQSPHVWPGYVRLSGDAVDDSSIPAHAPRERVPTLHFQNVLVSEHASLPEIQAAINQEILC